MNEPRDEALARVYREAEAPEPPQRIDDAILAASRRAAGSRPRASWTAFGRPWGMPVALAATVLVTFTLVLMVFERRSELETSELTTQLPAVPAEPAAKSSAEEKRAKTALKPAPRSEVLREARDRASEPQRRGDSAARGTAMPETESTSPPVSQPLYRAEPRPAPQPQLLAEPEAAAPAAAISGGLSTKAARVPPRAIGESVDSIGIRGMGYLSAEVVRGSPERWLEEIRQLKAQGRKEELERELAEFKRRYPDYRLPEDLR